MLTPGELMGGRYQFKLHKGYPALFNDAEVNDWMRDVAVDLVGETAVVSDELGMGAEDFSFMSQVAPGCFVRLGVHDPAWGDKVYNVHRADFRMDEDALPIGTAALAAAALNWMNQQKA